ncbi:MAG: metallophosphoesterase family protein [Armatimonadota bacterium]
MRVAVFSDVHANIHALHAVLADIRRREPDRTVCLGDLVGYGAFPNEVVEAIRQAGIPTVIGNYDDGVGFGRHECGCAYTEPADRERGDRSLRWTQKAVTDENKAWLRSLPRELRFEAGGKRVLCVHGSPRRINEYLYQDRPERSLARMLASLEADTVLCGHTHLPYHRRIGSIDLINVGSAGRPKDGDPRAVYAVIEITDEVGVTFPRVEYDVEAAAQAIERTDLPHEFADVLRRGM